MVLGFPVSSVLLYAIVAAAILIYVPYGVSVFSRANTNFDMGAPRAVFDQLPPYGKRAIWAHQNAFETFMVFAAAALMAYVTQQTSPLVGWAAIAFVVARLFYPVFYILDLPIGRSLMFGTGTTCIMILFIKSLQSLA